MWLDIVATFWNDFTKIVNKLEIRSDAILKRTIFPQFLFLIISLHPPQKYFSAFTPNFNYLIHNVIKITNLYFDIITVH